MPRVRSYSAGTCPCDGTAAQFWSGGGSGRGRPELLRDVQQFLFYNPCGILPPPSFSSVLFGPPDTTDLCLRATGRVSSNRRSRRTSSRCGPGFSGFGTRKSDSRVTGARGQPTPRYGPSSKRVWSAMNASWRRGTAGAHRRETPLPPPSGLCGRRHRPPQSRHGRHREGRHD